MGPRALLSRQRPPASLDQDGRDLDGRVVMAVVQSDGTGEHPQAPPPGGDRRAGPPPAGKLSSGRGFDRDAMLRVLECAPRFDRYAVIPVARNVWQHVQRENCPQ